ncbi:MAG: hypothetical protein R3C05_21605 [Pirellulaceae bacterium]
MGCSDPGPNVVPVSGVVTLDGEPLKFKSLTLFPTEGTAGQGAGGYTDGEGNYSLVAVVPNAIKDYRGCPPGKYRVVVSEPLIPISDADFANPAAADGGSGDDPAPAVFLPDEGKPQRKKPGDIPSVYTAEASTPLVIEVAEGNETVNLELVSTNS